MRSSRATAPSSSATWCTRWPSSTGGSRRSCRSRSRRLTGNGCHFHMSLWKDGTNVFLDESDPRGLGLSELGVPLRRRPQGARPCLQRVDGTDGELVQAPQARLHLERRDVVAGLDLVRLQQPHPDAADPGAGPDRGSHGRRLLQSVSGGRRGAGRPGSTGSRTELDAGEPNSENLYSFSYDELIRTRPAVAALDAARGDRRARAGRRPPRGSRSNARERGVRRLLRPRQAGGVVPLPRAGERLGGARVPDALLMGLSEARDEQCGTAGRVARPCAGSWGCSRSRRIEEQLGAHLVAMLAQMSDRGPDSAGVAVYRDPVPDGMTKLTLYSPRPGENWKEVAAGSGARSIPCVRATR